MSRALTSSTVDALAAIVGPDGLLTEAEDLIPYSFDGTAALKQRPEAVVFPQHDRAGRRGACGWPWRHGCRS